MTRAKTRKEILYEESAKLFVEKGYSATSIRGIAEKVGIEPSSIYSHINSKEDLLVKICMEAAHYFVDGMEEILDKKLSVFDTIEALVDLHIDAVEEAPTTVTVFTDEWKHLPEKVLEEFLLMRRGYEFNWRNILQDGIDSGLIRPLNTQLMAQTLLSSMRWVQTWVDEEKVKKLNDIKTELKTFVWKGLKKENN
jgi:AcrR family transcriptional regulator